MDFGALLGFEGTYVSSDLHSNQKLYGSGISTSNSNSNSIIHHQDDDDDDCKRSRDFKKVDKFDDLSAIQKTSLMRSNAHLASDSPQMLCFSSPNSQASTLPYYNNHPSSAYARNTASGYGSSMHGVRGPFTPSQWMELEHQALIYKYITANAPVPPNLLFPIRKALESAGFSCFPGSHLRPNALGWGAFHLGFSNTDPEPGRCRRTDGKKWRCSRDAVVDQKYCERHMNRGRHRSRKPVEGQSGQSSASRPPTAAANKVLPPSSSTPPPAEVPSGSASNSLSLSHHHQQLNNLHPGPRPSECSNLSRSFMNKANGGEKIQETSGLSMISPTIGLKRDHFSIPKQPNLYKPSSQSEFGLVCSNSLLNPLHKTYQDLNRETKSQHSLRQFMDDWPKNQSEGSPFQWPDMDMQSDRTQLSISIPVSSSSDFRSSTSSPTNEKHPPSPLRLSREIDLTQMNQKQANWIPISWENAMGGPLGEVLNSTNNSCVGDYKSTSALNLMTEGWDNCPSIASSPTGVLQKTTFRSVSNSSAGSSPRTETHRVLEGANFLGSNLISSSFPAL
ncbi:hypothetical protein LguiA_006544 [Lonicera macranthoides]